MWRALTGGAGAGAGDTGGVAARGRGVRPRGVLLSVHFQPGFVVVAAARPFLAAVQVTEGDPGVEDVVEGDLCGGGAKKNHC